MAHHTVSCRTRIHVLGEKHDAVNLVPQGARDSFMVSAVATFETPDSIGESVEGVTVPVQSNTRRHLVAIRSPASGATSYKGALTSQAGFGWAGGDIGKPVNLIDHPDGVFRIAHAPAEVVDGISVYTDRLGPLEHTLGEGNAGKVMWTEGREEVELGVWVGRREIGI